MEILYYFISVYISKKKRYFPLAWNNKIHLFIFTSAFSFPKHPLSKIMVSIGVMVKKKAVFKGNNSE